MDGLLALFGTAQAEALRPNIILVFVDDFGCRDLACYGDEKFKTSKLDRMSEKKTTVVEFLLLWLNCVPSRTGLMSGCHPPSAGNETLP